MLHAKELKMGMGTRTAVLYTISAILLTCVPCLEISVKYSPIVDILDCSGELDEPIKDQCLIKCSFQLPPLTNLGI